MPDRITLEDGERVRKAMRGAGGVDLRGVPLAVRGVREGVPGQGSHRANPRGLAVSSSMCVLGTKKPDILLTKIKSFN